jgi:hypothetical protein
MHDQKRGIKRGSFQRELLFFYLTFYEENILLFLCGSLKGKGHNTLEVA